MGGFRLNESSIFGFSNYMRYRQIIGVARIFDWGGTKPQTTCNDVIRNFRKKELFVGQRYRRMEDLKPWSVVT